jgi:biopolymer transport protein ExbB/TolQ
LFFLLFTNKEEGTLEELSQQDMMTLSGGEPVSLAAVMAVMIVAISAVIVYRLFMSSTGKATIPGGFQFEWK